MLISFSSLLCSFWHRLTKFWTAQKNRSTNTTIRYRHLPLQKLTRNLAGHPIVLPKLKLPHTGLVTFDKENLWPITRWNYAFFLNYLPQTASILSLWAIFSVHSNSLTLLRHNASPVLLLFCHDAPRLYGLIIITANAPFIWPTNFSTTDLFSPNLHHLKIFSHF